MHPPVIVFGLSAALLAGVADFFAALVSRKLGSFLTLWYVIASSVALLVLAQVCWFREALLDGPDVVLTFGIAGAAVAGYLAFYRGLALGPVAVVSPIAAIDGAVAALLGLALMGEALGPGHFAAVGLLVAGVALAATDWRAFRDGLKQSAKGPLLALVTMVGFGVALAGVGALARRSHSFLMPILALRCCIFVQLAAAAGLRRQRLLPGVGLGVLLTAAAVGLLDTASLLSFARGMMAEEGARVAVLGPLYGAYPVVTVLLSQAFLREKLVANQWAGVALVTVGTVLVTALGR
jgi:drug/metabolite transporter (DMT)-like permease